MLVFYQYKHDLERIQKHLRSYKPVVLKGTAEINDWNQGKISLLLAHAASAGHGLNLQDGGHLLDWFGCPWSLELYLQAVARLDRQGQKYIVVNGRLMCAGTIDMDVLAALENKDRSQNALLAAVKARIAKYSV
jgi:SNF2 family DNA or RNA helicase